jgi:hypothetical protein
VRAQTGIAAGLLWGDVASALVGTIGAIARYAVTAPTRPAGCPPWTRRATIPAWPPSCWPPRRLLRVRSTIDDGRFGRG